MNQSSKFIGYTDTNHVNDENDHKLFSDYCFFLNDKSAPITYSFKKQSLIAQSMIESEIITLSHAIKEIL